MKRLACINVIVNILEGNFQVLHKNKVENLHLFFNLFVFLRLKNLILFFSNFKSISFYCNLQFFIQTSVFVSI